MPASVAPPRGMNVVFATTTADVAIVGDPESKPDTVGIGVNDEEKTYERTRISVESITVNQPTSLQAEERIGVKEETLPKEEPVVAEVEIAAPPQTATLGFAANIAQNVAGQLQAGDYNSISRQLVCDGTHVEHTYQLWLSLMISRLGAAARGVEKTNLDPQGRLAGLHKSLFIRFEGVYAGYNADHRDGALVWAKMHDDQTLATKRGILRDLDILLVRLGSRAVDAKFVETTLSDILVRAVEESIRDAQLSP